jgi:protein phosphatase
VDTTEWKEHVLRWALLKAHQRILEAASSRPEWQGMATTAVVVQLDPSAQRAFIAHVGDSRAYLIRQGKIIQLTQDHSWVTEQIKVGVITAEEARVHPFRNVVTRALGGPQDPVVDIDEEPLLSDDILLLCTDGLSGVISDEDILSVVTRYGTDLEGAARELIQQANDHGGPDNITVVLVRIVADGN